MAVAVALLTVAACHRVAKAGTDTTSVRLAVAGSPSPATLRHTVDVLNARLRYLHLRPTASTAGTSIVVRLPKTGDTEATLAVLTDTGVLEFRPVLTEYDDPAQAPALTAAADDRPDRVVMLGSSSGPASSTHPSYQLGPSALDSTAIERAQSGMGTDGTWTVNPELRAGPGGIGAFNRLAEHCNEQDSTCPSQLLAIVYDHVVIAAPIIEVSEFDRNQIQISGSLTESSATSMAAACNSGPLPVALSR
jgi:preprotein translocase subunit SecD